MSNQPILKRPDDLGMDDAFVRDRFLEAKFRQLVKDYGIPTTGAMTGRCSRNWTSSPPTTLSA
jgi:hypothetical protein